MKQHFPSAMMFSCSTLTIGKSTIRSTGQSDLRRKSVPAPSSESSDKLFGIDDSNKYYRIDDVRASIGNQNQRRKPSKEQRVKTQLNASTLQKCCHFFGVSAAFFQDVSIETYCDRLWSILFIGKTLFNQPIIL